MKMEKGKFGFGLKHVGSGKRTFGGITPCTCWALYIRIN